MALKLSCVSESLHKCLPKFTVKNLTAIPLILILEYGQSNATLVIPCFFQARKDWFSVGLSEEGIGMITRTNSNDASF